MKDDCVIVLNKYEEYWSEIGLRRALRKLFNERATPVKEDKNHLLGVKKIGSRYEPIYKPLIIKLSYFDYYYYKSDKINYSDGAVYIRDKNECQYWHDYILEKTKDGKLIKLSSKRHVYTCKPSEQTIDHVLPLSRGGSDGFSNKVCACRYCNEIIKKDQTPEEAGLVLRREPKIPKRVKGDRARTFFSYDPRISAHKAYNEFLRDVSSYS